MEGSEPLATPSEEAGEALPEELDSAALGLPALSQVTHRLADLPVDGEGHSPHGFAAESDRVVDQREDLRREES